MSNLPTISNPWQQRADETDTAYHRFTVYLDLGPDRSLGKVGQELGKSSAYKRQLEKWSSKYSWVERAGKYDRHIQAKALEGRQEVINSAKGRLLQKVDSALDELFAIMEGPNSHFTEGSTSLVSQKLKAIELTLKLAGITPPITPPDEEPLTINNFIQNVYKKIERINNDKEND